jgi:putative MATE family efflux protein
MRSLWFANTCNIILCPILIHFYGLAGAAMATAIGRGLGVCFQVYYLFNGKNILKITLKHFGLDWKIIKALFDVSWVGFMQFFIGSASWMVMARILTSFNDDAAIAGYGLAIRIVMFFLLPAWGLSNAAATLTGQNLGAGQPHRAEESVLKTAKYNAIFMGVVTVIFMFFSQFIVSFMNKDEAVRLYAVQALRIISAGYIFYGIGMVLTNAFNGSGDTKTPTYINLFGFWFFQIPIAYLLAITFGLGPAGVFIAIPVSETAITIAAYILFKKGKWKTTRI